MDAPRLSRQALPPHHPRTQSWHGRGDLSPLLENDDEPAESAAPAAPSHTRSLSVPASLSTTQCLYGVPMPGTATGVHLYRTARTAGSLTYTEVLVRLYLRTGCRVGLARSLYPQLSRATQTFSDVQVSWFETPAEVHGDRTLGLCVVPCTGRQDALVIHRAMEACPPGQSVVWIVLTEGEGLSIVVSYMLHHPLQPPSSSCSPSS